MLKSDMDNNKPDFLNMMLVGTAGSGKTTTCCGLIPKVGEKELEIYNEICPLLYLDTERGAKLRLKSMKRDTKFFTLKEIKTIDQLSEVHTYLFKNPGKYKTVVIDSIQTLQRKGINKFSFGDETSSKDISNPGKLRIQDYGSSLKQIISVYEEFFKLDINLITTLIADWKDEKRNLLTGDMISPAGFKLALPESQRDIIPSLPDIVALIEINNKGVRSIRTNQTKKYNFVKDRVMPEITENAKLTETLIYSIIKYIKSL